MLCYKSHPYWKNNASKKYTQERKTPLLPHQWPLAPLEARPPKNSSKLGKAKDVYSHARLPVGVGIVTLHFRVTAPTLTPSVQNNELRACGHLTEMTRSNR